MIDEIVQTSSKDFRKLISRIEHDCLSLDYQKEIQV